MEENVRLLEKAINEGMKQMGGLSSAEDMLQVLARATVTYLLDFFKGLHFTQEERMEVVRAYGMGIANAEVDFNEDDDING